MRKISILSTLLILAFGALSSARAQDAAVKPSVVIGEITEISPSKIVLKTKDGALDVALSDKTEYRRISPEKPSLATATPAEFGDIGAGDKVAVTGIMAADKKSIPARTVNLMTKADLAGRAAKDQEQWKTRGVTGRVAAINAAGKELTVTSRGIGGETKLILTPKADAVFRRYAPDSVNYSEAKMSSLDEIKVGDSVRARGDKSADGANFAADEIISGSFQTVAGTITAIDAAKNEITLSDFQTKKEVKVVIGPNSILKQFPAEMAQRMAAFQGGGGGVQPPAGTRPPPADSQANGQNPPNGAGAGMRRGGGGGIDEMLERFPTISLADLKVGEMIAFSSTKSANAADRITAIKLLSGVEPFLKNAPAATGGGRRRGSGGADSGFTIPGLDSGF
ncbi:MAG: hypothetical protein M3T96_06165 [Acidobacteriota bacterium]|nr:hypothetical protein [Acidobacteriota bacterium]